MTFTHLAKQMKNKFGGYRFWLVRDEDETGISGTGHVASGLIWHDGRCVMRWDTAVTSTALYESLDDLIAIHGHGGKTRVVIHEDDAGMLIALAADVFECSCPSALFEDREPAGARDAGALAIYRYAAQQHYGQFEVGKPFDTHFPEYRWDGQMFRVVAP